MDKVIINNNKEFIDSYVEKLEKRFDEMIQEGEIDVKSFWLFKKTLDEFGTPEAKELGDKISTFVKENQLEDKIDEIEEYEKLKQSRMPH